MKKRNKIAIVVHGGAGPDSDRIRENQKAYTDGIQEAVDTGYKVLEKGGSAVDAVEAAVKALENNPIFNAGRGSALNADGEVEMDAAIMDGKTLSTGAVAMVRNIKNPVSLAKAVMLNTNYRFLGDMGALKYAKKLDIEMAPTSYFITEHQYDAFDKKRKEEFDSADSIGLEQINQRFHGTVGAVALDQDGNVAAATSTGGIENQKAGRIGDSCIIGAGCYANNTTCAVSSTGDGEIIIKQIIAHNISSVMEHKGLNVQQACDYVVHERVEISEGDIGVIAIDCEGNIGISFNSTRMHRGWKSDTAKAAAQIYADSKTKAQIRKAEVKKAEEKAKKKKH